MGYSHVDEAGVLEPTSGRHISCGAMLYHGGVGIVAGLLHSQGSEDVVADECLVLAAADSFDEVAEQHVAGVAVTPARPRLEVQRLVAESRYQLLGGG